MHVLTPNCRKGYKLLKSQLNILESNLPHGKRQSLPFAEIFKWSQNLNIQISGCPIAKVDIPSGK
jgi:hypothetical protein